VRGFDVVARVIGEGAVPAGRDPGLRGQVKDHVPRFQDLIEVQLVQIAHQELEGRILAGAGDVDPL
jgi:hypothetical protein